MHSALLFENQNWIPITWAAMKSTRSTILRQFAHLRHKMKRKANHTYAPSLVSHRSRQHKTSTATRTYDTEDPGGHPTYHIGRALTHSHLSRRPVVAVSPSGMLEMILGV